MCCLLTHPLSHIQDHSGPWKWQTCKAANLQTQHTTLPSLPPLANAPWAKPGNFNPWTCQQLMYMNEGPLVHATTLAASPPHQCCPVVNSHTSICDPKPLPNLAICQYHTGPYSSVIWHLQCYCKVSWLVWILYLHMGLCTPRFFKTLTPNASKAVPLGQVLYHFIQFGSHTSWDPPKCWNVTVVIAIFMVCRIHLVIMWVI